MTGQEIVKLARMLYNLNADEFAEVCYGKKYEGCEIPYINEKFDTMKNNALYWICTLDTNNLNRIAAAVAEYNG